MQLNCDLGESYGNWNMGHDAAVMPYIDQASIACGFHAGDPLTMRKTLALAAQHGVTIGAHPAYPDIVGFGRRSMTLSRDEIIACLHYQMAALEGMAQSQGLALSYVKPHGALYHDMMGQDGVRAAILHAIASYHHPLTLMMQSTVKADMHREEAKIAGVKLVFEAFTDRCYGDDGSLVHNCHIHSHFPMQFHLPEDSLPTLTRDPGRTLPLDCNTLQFDFLTEWEVG